MSHHPEHFLSFVDVLLHRPSREPVMSASVHANMDISWFVKDTHGKITVINERNKEVAGPFTTVADAWKWIRWNLPQAKRQT